MAELKPVFLNPLHETRISSDFPTNEKLTNGSVLSCWGGSSPWCPEPSKSQSTHIQLFLPLVAFHLINHSSFSIIEE